MTSKNLEEKGFVQIDGVWIARDVLFALGRMDKHSQPDAPVSELVSRRPEGRVEH